MMYVERALYGDYFTFMDREYKYITDRTYTTITGAMITELGLKGNELIVYALINGFCQDGESQFYGSITYLMEFTSLSKQGVLNVIESLIAKGLIEKEQRVINGVKFNSYKSCRVVKKVDYQPKDLTTINNKIEKELERSEKETISKDIVKKEEAPTNRMNIPLPFECKELRGLWKELMTYPEWKKKSAHAIELRVKTLTRLSRGDVDYCLAIVRQTLQKGWIDFYDVKDYKAPIRLANVPTEAKVMTPWEEMGLTKEQYDKLLKG